MANATIRWTAGSPQELADRIHRAALAVPDMVEESVKNAASVAEAEMKEDASWKDRTGNARQGLFGLVERIGNVIKMHLGGTMEYQLHLELGTKRMKKYAIIVPTWRKWRTKLVEEVIKDVMGLFQK